MGFSAKQIQALRRNLNSVHIRTKHANGRDLSYVEAWHAIAEANRIFGFDGWDRETVESRSVLAREIRGTYHTVYVAKVRITVHTDGQAIVREGHGSGEGRGPSLGEVHDIALKAAETDATKRALATFGRPFGLALYLHGRGAEKGRPVDRGPRVSPRERSGTHSDHLPEGDRTGNTTSPPETTPAAKEPQLAQLETTPAGIDEDVRWGPQATNPGILEIASPRRIRDRAHLKFVTTEPCLMCGRRRTHPVRATG